ncbi:hypothetical protein CDAR_292151 [Caerostris darwini]|uniref:Uncharacterized protein n=1 Tax=Caerostris darwini TaxID=1538125 RepID=A0AAV4V417_9ARAC|nr:hypothetical protein CDAR_292151 [Caerostris darwini]
MLSIEKVGRKKKSATCALPALYVSQPPVQVMGRGGKPVLVKGRGPFRVSSAEMVHLFSGARDSQLGLRSVAAALTGSLTGGHPVLSHFGHANVPC